jgi:putative thioredoxin
MAGQYVKDVDTAGFGEQVLQRSHEVPVVVDFWAEWCGPCRTLGPILEKLAGERNGEFELVKVDVDQNQRLATQFGVQGIPFVMAFRDGRPVSQFTGALPEAQVRSWLDELLPDEIDHQVEAARDALLEGRVDDAERLFREVLAARPDNVDAGTGLASVLLTGGHTEQALEVLAALPGVPEVERLRAAARVTSSQGTDLAAIERRLSTDPADTVARLELAAALAARGEFEPALDNYLRLVTDRAPNQDVARRGMLDVFEVLGAGHPLTTTYRRRLASALF